MTVPPWVADYMRFVQINGDSTNPVTTLTTYNVSPRKTMVDYDTLGIVTTCVYDAYLWCLWHSAR